jgi:hypothetical protein
MSEMSTLSTVLMIIGAISAVSVFMLSMYKIAKRIDQAVGVDADGKTLSERMSRVEHQLWENGGDSLKDQVNDIQKNQAEVNAKMGVIQEILVSMVEPKAKKSRKPNLNIVE